MIKLKAPHINILKPLPKEEKKKQSSVYESVEGKLQFYFSKRSKNYSLNHFYQLDDLTYMSSKYYKVQIGEEITIYFYQKKGIRHIMGLKQ